MYNKILKYLVRNDRKFKKASFINNENSLYKKNNTANVVEKITYGKAIVESAFYEKTIYNCFLNPIFSNNNLWYQYLGDPSSGINNEPKLADLAYRFFVKWDSFAKIYQENTFINYQSIFPLTDVTDYFFYKEILELEKTHGSKITTFIAIFYLNRMFNENAYWLHLIEEMTCDLQNIFRHKSALGWFIALIKTLKPEIEKNANMQINIRDIIDNLSYIHDLLEKDFKYNKISFPIVISTITPIALSLSTAKGFSYAAQCNLLMMEVMPQLKQKIITMEQSQLLNAARLLDYSSFIQYIPYSQPTMQPITVEESYKVLALTKKLGITRIVSRNSIQSELTYDMAEAYSLLYEQVRPATQNTEKLQKLLTAYPGQPVKFIKEVATVGVGTHFDHYSLFQLKKRPFNEYGDFEYGIVKDGRNFAVEVKPFGSRTDSYSKLVKLFEYQKTKFPMGYPQNFILVVDYSMRSNSITAGQLQHIEHLQKLIKENGLGDRIFIVNSGNPSLQINQDIINFSKNTVIQRFDRNLDFYQRLTLKEQNKLAGKTPMNAEDFLSFEKSFRTHILSEDPFKRRSKT